MFPLWDYQVGGYASNINTAYVLVKAVAQWGQGSMKGNTLCITLGRHLIREATL